MNTTNHTNYFPALTGIRAIAAYMVFLHHFNPFNPVKHKFLYDLISEMHTGVTIFFVLSGFLITFRYYEKQIKFKEYIKNRIARIYPMFIILTTLTFISPYLINIPNEKESLGMFFMNITFIKGFFSDFKFSGIAQSWSLTVEETFYFLAPIIFILIARKSINFFILPIIIILFGILLVLIFQNSETNGFYDTFEFMFNYTFTGRCLEFFIGMGLAILLKKGVKLKFNYFTYFGVLMIFLSIYSISLFKGNNDFGIRHPVGIMINTLILPLFGISSLLYGLINEETLLKKLLSSKLFIIAGKSSYIFYLIHLGIFAQLLSIYFSSNFIILFLLLNAISVVLYYSIEEPLNQRIRNIEV